MLAANRSSVSDQRTGGLATVRSIPGRAVNSNNSSGSGRNRRKIGVGAPVFFGSAAGNPGLASCPAGALARAASSLPAGCRLVPVRSIARLLSGASRRLVAG
jgi:hypothetical protein